jgi:hypothetical protein
MARHQYWTRQDELQEEVRRILYSGIENDEELQGEVRKCGIGDVRFSRLKEIARFIGLLIGRPRIS